MKLVYGNLWNSDCEINAVTTNSFIRSDGSLVMGRGAALQASQRLPSFQELQEDGSSGNTDSLGNTDGCISPNSASDCFR